MSESEKSGSERAVYVVRCPDKHRWTEDFDGALEMATGEHHTDVTGDEPDAAEITAMFPSVLYNRYAWIDDEPGDICGRECLECGVEIDAGSLRWNGWVWEHKNPNVHPQAGHHVIRSLQAESKR